MDHRAVHGALYLIGRCFGARMRISARGCSTVSANHRPEARFSVPEEGGN
jgi:hypothetical protein